MPDSRTTRDFAHEKETKAPEGTTVGVSTGESSAEHWARWSGSVPWLFPVWDRWLPPARSWPVLLDSAPAARWGGLVGAFVGMGIPEYEAKRYEGRVKNGGVLLSVHCNSSEAVRRAKHTLEGTGAEDVASASESAGVKTSSPARSTETDRHNTR
jgi:hypothetical protein